MRNREVKDPDCDKVEIEMTSQRSRGGADANNTDAGSTEGVLSAQEGERHQPGRKRSRNEEYGSWAGKRRMKRDHCCLIGLGTRWWSWGQ